MTARVRRGLAAAALAVLACAGLLPPGGPGGPTSATAGPGGPTSATAAAEPSDPIVRSRVTVSIDAVTPAVLRPGDDLTVTAQLRNDGDEPLDGVTAVLRLNRFRPASRDELESWITGSSGAIGSRVAVGTPQSLAPGATAHVSLTVPSSGIRLLDVPGTWGPRGLAVQAVDATGDQLGVQRTFALWQRDEVVPQVRVALLAPVTATATATDELERATAQGARLRELVDLAAADPDLELAVDPALLAAAQEGGQRAVAWADDLVAALGRRDSYALPWSDPDLAAIAHADSPSLLTAARDLAATSGLAEQPARTDVLWAPGAGLDQVTADSAAASGARALVVDPNTLQADGGVGTARVDLETANGNLAALVPDGLLTDLFVEPGRVEAGATTATAVQRLLAELAVLAHDGSTDPRYVLLAPGRDWSPDPELVTALLDALRHSPWSRLVPVSAVLGAADDGVERDALPERAVAGLELSADEVRGLAGALDETTAFATAIGDAGMTDGLAQRVLAPLSVGRRSDEAGRSALVRDVVTAATRERTGLSLAPAPDLNIISASASVRFVMRNDLTVPATVAVQVEPRKACLRPARSDAVTVDPGSEQAVVVELVAAANCDVTVDAHVVGAQGEAVGEGVEFSARVTPTIEDVSTIVVGVLLALGMLLGIVRTARRGRSARRGARRVAEEDVPTLPVLGGEVLAPDGPRDGSPAESSTQPPADGPR